MSFKCQIFTTRLTFHNVLELSCDVSIIIFLFSLIAILPPNIKCAKLSNPQIRLLINDDDLLHEKTSRHEAGGASVHTDHSGEHFNLYRSELKRLSYETIHRILRDENEPSYRREETELRYYQKRSPSAYEESHQLKKRSAALAAEQYIALDYSKRKLKEFVATPQIEKELQAASSLDLSDNHLSAFTLSLLSAHVHTLNLSNNSFPQIPLQANTTLRSINLNGNNIRVSPLTPNIYLHELYLAANQIENVSAVNLALLKNLEILDISCNRLRSMGGTSFFAERMHNLKHLNMAHNQLGTIYRETFYNLLSLNTLLLGHNNISDIDYETFLALPNLQYLDLSYNRLRGKSIRALQGITGLVALNIAFNSELGPYMQEFVASWSLKELDASGTGLCQIPAALAQSVRSLKLTHNWLKIINCGDLDSYPLLQYLDLSFSHIEDIEDDALGRLEILEVLMLDNNRLSKIPLSLPVSLEHLFLQNNNIMDIQSQSFQGLNSLKTLDLSHNKLLYLPDVALPKLQTLSLQSSDIRGISQGIVHTLPRLNELMLEDNPIKCSDLLGIAEWASTCRLRLGKEDEELSQNEGSESEDEDDVNGGGSKELKRKFESIHNFYDQFGGEYCQIAKGEDEQNVEQPLCVNKEEKSLPLKGFRNIANSLNNLKRSPLPSVVLNLSSIMAIPLPAKKAMKTLSAAEYKGNCSAPHKDDEGVTTMTTKQSVTEAYQPLEEAKQMHLNIEKDPILGNSNNNDSSSNRNNSNNNNNHNNDKRHSTKTFIQRKTLPAEAGQTFEEFAFEDKPQQHSNDAKKTFATKTATTIITTTTTTAGVASTSKTSDAPTTSQESAIEMPDKEKDSLHLSFEKEVTAKSAESLRAANLAKIFKQTTADDNIPQPTKGQTVMIASTVAATAIKATAATAMEMPPSALAINLSQPPQMAATVMAEQGNAASSLPEIDATITATSTSATSSKSNPNPFKEIAQNIKAIKTKIGPTKQIKFVEVKTQPAAADLPIALPSPKTTTTPTATMTMAAFPSMVFESRRPSFKSSTMFGDESYSPNTNKELTSATTTTSSNSGTITAATTTTALTMLKANGEIVNQTTSSETTETWPTGSDKAAPILGSLMKTTLLPTAAATMANTTTTATSIATPIATQTLMATTSTSYQDEIIASNNEDGGDDDVDDVNNKSNSINNNNNNSNTKNNYNDSHIGQENDSRQQADSNGPDDNKTFVTLNAKTIAAKARTTAEATTATTATTTTANIIMPITPLVNVLHSNENQTIERHSLHPHPQSQKQSHSFEELAEEAASEENKQSQQLHPQDMQQGRAAIQHELLQMISATTTPTTTMTATTAAAAAAIPNDGSTVTCLESQVIGCISSTATTKTAAAAGTPIPSTLGYEHEAAAMEQRQIGRDIGKVPAMEMAMSTPLAPSLSRATISVVAAATLSPTTAPRKHEPVQLHIKDRHLIGTPLLMHKGDNLMVTADELVKPNGSQDPHKIPTMMTTIITAPPPAAATATTATTTATTTTPTTTTTTILPPSSYWSSTSSIFTGPAHTAVHELNRKSHSLDKSQNQKFPQPKMSKAQRHHEPLEHKGETIKDKDYVQYKKSNADMKTKKPSLIMKKMTIITKQHESGSQAAPDEHTHGHNENEIHHQKDLMTDGHYQELKPLNKDWESGTPRHSTVNTPINKKSNVPHEPQTFQHEHELMLQQILHDEQQQQQQQQHGKASQSEQWSDLRRSNDTENHPGLILLVSSGLFVVLLLGLMHVYRCDVPWRRNSPTHHLRPHQRHNGAALEDDVHSFLSYNEGMQKWHHSTRLEAPYSSPLHNLHVRELQKTSATEKAATFKPPSASYSRHLNRTHILPRTNSQSSSATTRTTSPSSSAILDDETFYIEMTPSTGQFAQALQSELLPMELLNMAQAARHASTKEASTDFHHFSLDEEEADFNAAAVVETSPSSILPPINTHHVATRGGDLLAVTSTATLASSATNSNSNSNSNNNSNALFNHIGSRGNNSTRKFGLW